MTINVQTSGPRLQLEFFLLEGFLQVPVTDSSPVLRSGRRDTKLERELGKKRMERWQWETAKMIV